MQLIRSQLQQQLTPGRQRILAFFLALVLGLGAAWWLATLTWQLFTPADSMLIVTNEYSSAPRGSVEADVNLIQQLNIFGDRAAVELTQEAALNAPETTLNVRLVGLVASVSAARSAAIIEQSGSQQTYVIGETIAGSRATVEGILPDRVLLDNAGRREVLYIEGRDGAEAQLRIQAPPTAQGTQSQQSDSAQSVNLGDSDEALEVLANVRENPSVLLEVINISPVRNGQSLVGYRLQPRQNRDLFAALGLEPGDIALTINGFDSTEPGLGGYEYRTQATVQLRRGNQLIDLELSVP